MAERVRCPFCGDENVVRHGFRKLKGNAKQRYSCRSCHHRFSIGLDKKRFGVKTVFDAVCLYNQGYTYEEVCDAVYRKHKANVSVTSVSRWVKEYDLGYSGIRLSISQRHAYPVIIGRVFKHSGLIYNFKYHHGKLKCFGKFPGLKRFILGLSRGIDENYFTDKNSRCSQIKKDTSINIKAFDNTRLNKAVGSALKIVKNNKQRHSIVENLMLSCDRDTIAVEVPVWYWDKQQNVGVCGHIDVLQVRYGKVWVLDYKPNAEHENVDKVVSQLFSYALALSFRAGIRLKDVMCGWFDENKVYVFDADKVRINMQEDNPRPCPDNGNSGVSITGTDVSRL